LGSLGRLGLAPAVIFLGSRLLKAAECAGKKFLDIVELRSRLYVLLIGNVWKVEVLSDHDSLFRDLDRVDFWCAVVAAGFSGIGSPLVSVILPRPDLLILDAALRQGLFVVRVVLNRVGCGWHGVADACWINCPVMGLCRLVPALLRVHPRHVRLG